MSEYAYERRYIKIHPDGRIAGGLSRFVTSLVDFSFIRSIVAHKYKPLGGAYDPVSLFLLELFRYLEKYPTMSDFVKTIRDREKGKHYRLYAGIKYPHWPCEGTFTNLKDRLGEDLYNHILHVLVEIAERLGFLSYKIIATDGTLFPTNARYKGCTYFCDECNFIEFKGIIENVRQRILYRLNNPEKIIPGKEIRLKLPFLYFIGALLFGYHSASICVICGLALRETPFFIILTSRVSVCVCGQFSPIKCAIKSTKFGLANADILCIPVPNLR